MHCHINLLRSQYYLWRLHNSVYRIASVTFLFIKCIAHGCQQHQRLLYQLVFVAIEFTFVVHYAVERIRHPWNDAHKYRLLTSIHISQAHKRCSVAVNRKENRKTIRFQFVRCHLCELWVREMCLFINAFIDRIIHASFLSVRPTLAHTHTWFSD